MLRTLTRDDAAIAETSMCDVFTPEGDAGIVVSFRDLRPETMALAKLTDEVFLILVESHDKLECFLSIEVEIDGLAVDRLRAQRRANGCDELTGDEMRHA